MAQSLGIQDHHSCGNVIASAEKRACNFLLLFFVPERPQTHRRRPLAPPYPGSFLETVFCECRLALLMGGGTGKQRKRMELLSADHQCIVPHDGHCEVDSPETRRQRRPMMQKKSPSLPIRGVAAVPFLSQIAAAANC